ncbi:hypothetical protein THAOC_34562 [Thalassiosira oceanica]|uniref:Uncharacterized protein n=1 Tax=Thalassiosira oceanica TaxID=159749 RepID=K0R4S9_THAOC|nr:hypothetical protein THAOC_34562 [Thalassiosira oceanica]|eukprot:EJK46754.1 hypothetical protein THAOC_34562 [Thalassiosira oceanica]
MEPIVADVKFFGLYAPSSSIDSYASLDAHLRAIKATPKNGSGLQKAYQIYTLGVEDETNGSHTIWRLANRAHIQLEESETIQYLTDFYGLDDFSDKWLMAAFSTKDDEKTTAFTRGNVNFSSFVGVDARLAAIESGIAALVFWPYVLGSFEVAHAKCRVGDTSNSASRQYWDQGVALYAGEQVQTGKGSGSSLFALAEALCPVFGKCGENRAPINTELFEMFRAGQDNLNAGKCDAVKGGVEKIKSLMMVPLIQGALLSVYAIDKGGHDSYPGSHDSFYPEDALGEAAAFGSAMFPFMIKCSEGDGQIVENDMFPQRSKNASLSVVQAAFERCYTSFNIDSKWIGEIVEKDAKPNPSPTPMPKALLPNPPSPTSQGSSESVRSQSSPTSSSSSGNTAALIVGLGCFCAVLLALLILTLKGINNRQRKTKEFLTQHSDSKIVSDAKTGSSSNAGGGHEDQKEGKASDAEIV